MLFTIVGVDVPDSREGRKIARPAHVKRLKKLNEEGRLVIAGPHPESEHLNEENRYTGSLIVAEFESLQAARNWADADPYIEAGVYAEVMIKPFIKALP